MTDNITKHTQIMKELNSNNALDYFDKTKDLIQKYTGTLAHHTHREELLCQRYELAKLLCLYKKRCEE